MGEIFVVLYVVCLIATAVFVLTLVSRFVSAHEKMAASAEIIARKLKEEARP